MSKDIFSGLDQLGFDNINSIDLYSKDEEQDNNPSFKKEQTEQEKLKNYLYDKKVTCPVCGSKFTVKAVKTSSYKMKKKDSDLFIRYEIINPYFYDVWLCNTCGYAAMKADFEKIRNFQIDLVKQKIAPKWKGREYTSPYDVNIAIERYKLSLLNYYYTDSKASRKAFNCLKLAWMYRLTEDLDAEKDFLKQALKGFNDAYFNEDFPIYGMNKFTVMYLIGELSRRTDNIDEAMVWFSKVITTPGINQRLKELARDQKDLIKEAKSGHKTEEKPIDNSSSKQKKGFFSSLFNK
ncbi:DUF2225 domain-containing protein [Clostridium ganghwense]|uniref:DUF2225 domain-containing protein n=1 Tax=Clostridium ganghwense TaxID=312089 RepID=A0ABT4CKI4_9CLOT|nr:DUF2225 domain-containing protein [Clostridium ganghwense]